MEFVAEAEREEREKVIGRPQCLANKVTGKWQKLAMNKGEKSLLITEEG
jgi:hypothetical protein